MDMLYCRRVLNSHATSKHACVRGMRCLPHCCVSCTFCLHASYGHAVALEAKFHCSFVTRPSSATSRRVSRGHHSPLVGGPQATLNTAVAKWGLGSIRQPGESNSSKKLVVRLRHICTAERGDIWCESSCLECQGDEEMMRTMTDYLLCVHHWWWAPWWFCVLQWPASARTWYIGPSWMKRYSLKTEPNTVVLCILQQAMAPAVLPSGLEILPPPEPTNLNWLTCFMQRSSAPATVRSSVSQEIPHTYGTTCFNVFPRAHHLSPNHLNIILSLGPSHFQTRILHIFLFSPIHATCPTHLILLDFITWIILGGEYISWSSSLCSFPILSYFLAPNIPLSIPFWNSPSLCPSPKVKTSNFTPYQQQAKL